jgi:hypothetical protein
MSNDYSEITLETLDSYFQSALTGACSNAKIFDTEEVVEFAWEVTANALVKRKTILESMKKT